MELCFAVDKSLGRLAKWLRLLGFDTWYQAGGVLEGCPDLNDRIVLTRSRKVFQTLDPARSILIVHNEWSDQMRQVIQVSGIRTELVRPFSRCLQCNTVIKIIDKKKVYGKVPDYIWEMHDHFSSCPGCGHIFWRGSHLVNSMEKIVRFLNPGVRKRMSRRS